MSDRLPITVPQLAVLNGVGREPGVNNDGGDGCAGDDKIPARGPGGGEGGAMRETAEVWTQDY